jgi:ferredoxin
MAHHLENSGYNRLTERLNRFPQGAPPSNLLAKILQMLMSNREAELVSLLPVRPFTAKQAEKAWNMSEKETKKTLDNLAGRAVLVDIIQEGKTQYVLPPPMAGFFEFSLMRVREDIDQKVLSELFYRRLAKLSHELCLGCGLCVRACPEKVVTLRPREERVITPVNSAHRTVVMAIERGKLQHLIFDNRVLWSHRALAALFGVIFKLPPIKQVLANRQLQSRYLGAMMAKM